MSNLDGRSRTLGIYIVILSLYQIGLYSSAQRNQLAVFDPRVSISYFSEELFSLNPSIGNFAEWASAVWLLLVGVVILFWGQFIRVYVVTEFVLGMITASFLVFMILNQSGHAVLSGLPLIGTVVLFVIVTCVPVCLAFRMILTNKTRHVLTIPEKS